MALVAPIFGGKYQFLKDEDPGGNMAEKKEERPGEEKPSSDRPGKKKFFDFKIDLFIRLNHCQIRFSSNAVLYPKSEDLRL